MHLCIRQVLEIGLAALTREKNVALTPENDRLRLLRPKERLLLGIKFDVGAVVVREVKLDAPRIGPMEIVQIHSPVVRTDQLWLGMTVGIDELHGIGLQKSLERHFGLPRSVFPVGAAQAVPNRGKTDLLCIGVLDNQPFQPLWTPRDAAETNWSAIILNVKSKRRELGLLKEGFDYLRRPVEGNKQNSTDQACPSCRTRDNPAR